jgi:hypothetical protein
VYPTAVIKDVGVINAGVFYMGATSPPNIPFVCFLHGGFGDVAVARFTDVL